MTTLEDLIACERDVVDPTPAQVKQLERRMGAALGIGVGVVASATSIGASAKSSSLLAKLGSSLFSKSTILWGAGAVAGVGLGYSVAVMTDSAREEPRAVAHSIEPARPPAAIQEALPPEPSEAPSQNEPISGPPVEAAAPVGARVTIESAADARPRDLAEPTTPLSPVDRLKQDAQLLSQVSAALNRGAPAEALKLLDGASLKGSPLGTEFKAARAIALCHLGHHSQGQSIMQSLKATAPESPALLRVTQVCGEK
jgi:hypothetical protein